MEAVLKLLISALFGAFIGIERQIRGRQAGFRTQLLVCFGSCLFTIISIRAYEIYGTVTDPGRIAAQIITGIGFLGAGAILKTGNLVRGLTTAASLWVVSAVGMAVGFGEYLLAAVATAIAIANLVLLKYFESALAQENYADILIKTSGDEELDVRAIVKEFGIKAVENKYRYLKEEKIIEHTVSLKYTDAGKLTDFYRRMKQTPNLIELRIL
ncbi:MAG: MgtC/SapB family protein [Nitrospinae bacterium]|nr:MgtC/SapB family protein [Nitrospinota bacterium]